ncbi:hypothetical protein J2Y70_002985 [Xanthomonas translucens]|nr:hypothetical protein [Xanthomonas translucens]
MRLLGKRDRGPGTGDPDKRGIGAADTWILACSHRSPTPRPPHDHRVPGPWSLVPTSP